MSRVFVDTMIFRYAADVKVVYSATSVPGSIKSPDGAQRSVTLIMHETSVKEPNKVDAKLEREIGDLKTVADLANKGALDLVYSHEVDLELLFQPLVDIYPGRFFGAPITRISSPLNKPYFLPEEDDLIAQIQLPYSVINDHEFRPVLRLHTDKEKILRKFLALLPEGHFVHMQDFRKLLSELRETSSIPNAASLLLPIFKNIKNPRYLEICRELKAQDTPNTFLDAYHLWTAETENCDFFLTTEGKIGKLYGNAPVRVVTPSELCNLMSH
jgi:hypothetical protein